MKIIDRDYSLRDLKAREREAEKRERKRERERDETCDKTPEVKGATSIYVCIISTEYLLAFEIDIVQSRSICHKID